MSETHTHTHTNKVDIAIVGGGMIGLTLANLLAANKTGLSILVIDGGAPSALDLTAFDPRVIALSKSNQRLLNHVGVWEKVITARACPYFDMQVWDGEGTADIHFDAAGQREENLGHIVENKVIVNALLDNLNGIEILFNTKVESFTHLQDSEQSLLVLSNGDKIAASLVVAADGANSSLRQLAGFTLREWDYGHTAIVSTVRTEKPHAFTAWQRFSAAGPLAFLPLTLSGQDQQHCSIVWSIEHRLAEKYMALNDETFCQVLTSEFEAKLGRVEAVEKRVSFPLRQRHATRYVAPGIVLVGDAAHTIHPLAGQGANIGMYDVEVLSEEIQRAVQRGVAIADPSIGKRYERRRQAHNLIAMSAMEGFKRLFAADDLLTRWLRNEGLRTLGSLPWFKKQFSKMASGRV